MEYQIKLWHLLVDIESEDEDELYGEEDELDEEEEDENPLWKEEDELECI